MGGHSHHLLVPPDGHSCQILFLMTLTIQKGPGHSLQHGSMISTSGLCVGRETTGKHPSSHYIQGASAANMAQGEAVPTALSLLP